MKLAIVCKSPRWIHAHDKSIDMLAVVCVGGVYASRSPQGMSVDLTMASGLEITVTNTALTPASHKLIESLLGDKFIDRLEQSRRQSHVTDALGITAVLGSEVLMVSGINYEYHFNNPTLILKATIDLRYRSGHVVSLALAHMDELKNGVTYEPDTIKRMNDTTTHCSYTLRSEIVDLI